MIQPQDYFLHKKGTLYAGDVPVEKIIKKVGTPAYLYHSNAFLEPIQELKKHLKGHSVLISYAVKSNSNLEILRLIKKQGLGVDIVSGGELFRAKKVAFPGNKIVFSGVGKTPEEIKAALFYSKNGIFSFNVESEEELEAIEWMASKKQKKASISLRFNPDIDAKTHPYISTGKKTNKFGIPENHILEILERWKDSPWLKFSGLSIHIGSQILSLDPMKEAFDKMKTLFSKANEILNQPLSFVDLGGGLGICYQNENPPSIESYCDLIKKTFPKDLKIVIEPGRLISGNAGILVTKVLYRKKSHPCDFLIVDAGMNDLIRPALYQGHHQITPVKESHLNRSSVPTHVVGPVCESADFLPKNDLFLTLYDKETSSPFLSAGAYSFSMSSQYNSRPRAAEVLITGKGFKVIRKRETFSDLVRGE